MADTTVLVENIYAAALAGSKPGDRFVQVGFSPYRFDRLRKMCSQSKYEVELEQFKTLPDEWPAWSYFTELGFTPNSWANDATLELTILYTDAMMDRCFICGPTWQWERVQQIVAYNLNPDNLSIVTELHGPDWWVYKKDYDEC